jgi:periplasmic protein TonB
MRSAFLAFCLLTALLPCRAWQDKTDQPVYAVGKGIKPPRVISNLLPDFSSDAKRGKFRGVVVITAVIGIDGKVHDAEVAQSMGDAILDAKVLNAVKNWKFKPATKERQPVACRMNLEVDVVLN